MLPVSKGPPFTVSTPSRSRPGIVYQTIVSDVDGRTCVCNCPAFWRVGECAHEPTARGWYGVYYPEKELPTLTQALTIQEPRQLVPVMSSRPPKAMIPTGQETFDMIHLSNALAKSAGFAIPKHFDDSRKVFAVIYRGWELGVRPMVALNHMFVVSGKVESDAQLLMGIVMARDHSARFKFIQHDDEGCVVELSRSGDVAVTIAGKWTREDATISGQLTIKQRPKVARWNQRQPIYERDEAGELVMEDLENRWVTHWKDMVAWAAVKRACRLGAPDLINGIEGAGGIREDAPLEVDETTGPALTVAGMEPPEFEAPVAPFTDSEGVRDGEIVGEYPWFKAVQAAKDDFGLTPTDWNRVVGIGSNDRDALFSRIDDWIFQIEVSDMPARVNQLVKAVVEARDK